MRYDSNPSLYRRIQTVLKDNLLGTHYHYVMLVAQSGLTCGNYDDALYREVSPFIATRRLSNICFIGLMWGNNAFFGAGSAIAAGLIVQQYG